MLKGSTSPPLDQGQHVWAHRLEDHTDLGSQSSESLLHLACEPELNPLPRHVLAIHAKMLKVVLGRSLALDAPKRR